MPHVETEIAPSETAAALLRRSLERDRLGHAYLFTGEEIPALEDAAASLARTLLCETPRTRSHAGMGVEPCLECSACRRVSSRLHPDVLWVHPAKKMRQISIDQMREVIHSISLKPLEGTHKLGIIVGADRMNEAAANAFLKTLEEPPRNSILVLLCTEPQRLLDTILSRCLRLNFGTGIARLDAAAESWLTEFATATAASSSGGLLPRYRLLGTLLNSLAARRDEIEKTLEASSPLNRYADAEGDQRERWETELTAGIEAEYRKCRADYLSALQWWLRDIWLCTLPEVGSLARFPNLMSQTQTVASRLDPVRAGRNLESWEKTQRLLYTNVQEALALEVGLLRLQL